MAYGFLLLQGPAKARSHTTRLTSPPQICFDVPATTGHPYLFGDGPELRPAPEILEKSS